MMPLPAYINKHEKSFAEKGWHVHSNSFYLGLSGYKKDKKNGNLIPREEHIVSLNCFRMSIDDTDDEKTMWEVKTYWTTKRNLFEEFSPALEMFVEQEKKYDPRRMIWTKLSNEEIQIAASAIVSGRQNAE